MFAQETEYALENSKPNNVIPSASFTDTELKESLNKLCTRVVKPVTPFEAIVTRESNVPLNVKRFIPNR